MQFVHLIPITFDLQVHTPIEVQDVEEDPVLLHPQAVKETICSMYYKYIMALTVTVWIVVIS